MKIGFVSDSLTSAAGGIFEIERCLALALDARGFEVMAWGVDDGRWEHDGPLWDPVPCRLLKRRGPRGFGYAPGWTGELVESGCDLLHLQHLWMYPSIAVHRWHRRSGRPYLVTPNGMLEPWTLGNSGWKKRLAGLAYERRMLRGAACLQANTRKEAEDFRSYGLTNPICLIPNGVSLPSLDRPQGTKNQEPKSLLYLGRLHPKKGLVTALRAWAQLPDRAGWRLVIAGWDQGGHEAELKRLCRELGIPFSSSPAGKLPTKNEERGTKNEERISFPGPAFGAEKDALFRAADAFLLPSHSEGLPMAVLEAWSYGLPVLMTPACNLPEGFAAGAALEIGNDPDSIAEGMRALTAMGEAERQAMGAAGRRLVEERFTWPKVAAQMAEVYEWMLGGGERPRSFD